MKISILLIVLIASNAFGQIRIIPRQPIAEPVIVKLPPYHSVLLSDVVRRLHKNQIQFLTLDMVKYWQSRGLQFNEPLDQNRNTFLILLTNNRGTKNIHDIVQYVLEHGADPMLANDSGVCAYDSDQALFGEMKKKRSSQSKI